MKSKKDHKRLRDLGFYLGNSLIGLVFASPLLWMVAASFKPELAIFSNINSIRTFIPEHFSLANYIEVFRRLNIPQILGNTFSYIAIVLLGDLLFGSMCGYALAKLDFRGRGPILTLVIALMSMPDELLFDLYVLFLLSGYSG